MGFTCLSKISSAAEAFIADDTNKVLRAGIHDLYDTATNSLSKELIRQELIAVKYLVCTNEELNKIVANYLKSNEFIDKAIDYTRKEIPKGIAEIESDISNCTKALASGNYMGHYIS